MKIKLNLVSRAESDTRKIAYEIMDRFVLPSKQRCVVFLEGELGSGKTTFVRFALEKLGVAQEEFDGSPTFTIVNEYGNNIFHIDLFRLSNDEDILNAGVYDYLKGDGIFFIEWPEKLNVIPNIVVEFKELSGQEREIHVYLS